jgi:hypothetical protein
MISDNRLYSALAIERSTFVYNFLVSILAMYTDLLYRNLSNKKLLEYCQIEGVEVPDARPYKP